MMMKIILDDGFKVFRDVAAKAITMIELGQNSVKSEKIWKLDRCSHLHPWSNINNENAQIENGDPNENDKKKENGDPDENDKKKENDDLTLGRSKGRWWLKVLGSTRSCQGPEISSLVMIIIIIIIVIFIMIIIKIISSFVLHLLLGFCWD